VLEEVIDLISRVDIGLIEGESKSQVANFSFIKTYCEENNINYKCLMKLFRLSLINKDVSELICSKSKNVNASFLNINYLLQKGPPIGELFTVLRKNEFLKRLKCAVNYINDYNNTAK